MYHSYNKVRNGKFLVKKCKEKKKDIKVIDKAFRRSEKCLTTKLI